MVVVIIRGEVVLLLDVELIASEIKNNK